MSDVHLEYLNEVNIRIRTDLSTLMEIKEAFTFKAEGYQFSPRYKARVWDGNISLLKQGGIIYAGLAQRIKKFCESRDYEVTWDDELYYENVSKVELLEFIETLNLPDSLQVRDYQLDSILRCIRSRRRTLRSPTSSGKSLIAYILFRWYLEQGHKGLIIVPTTGLVRQMASDFIEYGYQGDAHLSVDKLSKGNIKEPLCITTWQSLSNGKTKMSKDWYSQFGMFIADEAHGVKAKSLIEILSALDSCRYRFGMTGTLDDKVLNTYTIEGLCGAQYSSISTKELIDEGYATPLKIKCIILKYDEETSKEFHKTTYDPKSGKQKSKTYAEEITWLIENERRNKFISNLTNSLKGNKLLFFRIIEHGKTLFELVKKKSKDKVFFISGAVKSEEREAIRKAIEEEHNATLVASGGTTATGVNIKRLHHLIFGAPSKSKIKVLQSIGRMLRKHESKEQVVLYDIVDDIRWKNKKNFALEHFIERSKIYDSECFDWEVYQVKV